MANRSSRSRPPLGISRLSNRLAGAVISAAEGLGSDGQGRDGLRGYLLFLARKYPVQFLTWLIKMARAQLLKRPRRRSRTSNDGWTPERQIAINEGIISAVEGLGSDGKGRGELLGTWCLLASGGPSSMCGC
jgi:hypothetical protein